MLNHFRGFNGHLVCQISHRNGFWHMYFNHARLYWLLRCTLLALIALALTTRATTPRASSHAARTITACFESCFFLLLICPSGRQFFRFNFLLAAFCVCRCRWFFAHFRLHTSAYCRLMQRAFDDFRFFNGLRLFSHHHTTTWATHHGANRVGFIHRFLTTIFQINRFGCIICFLLCGQFSRRWTCRHGSRHWYFYYHHWRRLSWNCLWDDLANRSFLRFFSHCQLGSSLCSSCQFFGFALTPALS